MTRLQNGCFKMALGLTLNMAKKAKILEFMTIVILTKVVNYDQSVKIHKILIPTEHQ
jgi:hypothetical protein